MLISATLSKPVSNIEEILGKPYTKIKITAQASAQGYGFFVEQFTEKQVFHKHFSESEAEEFIFEHAGKTFKNCVKRTETEEITILGNKKGKITTLSKKTSIKMNAKVQLAGTKDNRKKNYLLEEGKPVPFLVLLGIMTPEGKVVSAKYDKFRQINRFLEFIDDVIDDVIALKKNANTLATSPADSSAQSGDDAVRVADFGCGKSYLTFAVHYFLTEIRHIPCHIEGLDLKKDVIDYCNEITRKLKLENLIFHTGNISDYSGESAPDIVITLHACDTATDYALEYAVEKGAKAILSVPCCQHEINSQLGKNKTELAKSDFSSLLKYGLIRERFSALLTDALRGEWLESKNYSVQLLEFIDMEHTPKNILIRAVQKSNKKTAGNSDKNICKPAVLDKLNITPEIWK